MKWLLTLLIIVVALMWWFGKARGATSAARRARGLPAPQDMVACAHCGIHLPQPDAMVGEQGRLYCCAEHRRLGPQLGR